MNVFVLEDDAETSAFIERGLRERGHLVEVVRDGDAALRRLQDSQFDVLILDRMVPGMDGLAVLKAIRAAGQTTPALLLTAMSQIADRVAGLEEGADDYLVKPFAFAELAARVTALGRTPRRGGALPKPLRSTQSRARFGSRVIDEKRRPGGWSRPPSLSGGA